VTPVVVATNFATKLTNSDCVRYLQDSWIYSRVFGDVPSNDAKQIFPRATLVTMATKFGT